jgi:hypothetical protein
MENPRFQSASALFAIRNWTRKSLYWITDNLITYENLSLIFNVQIFCVCLKLGKYGLVGCRGVARLRICYARHVLRLILFEFAYLITEYLEEFKQIRQWYIPFVYTLD